MASSENNPFPFRSASREDRMSLIGSSSCPAAHATQSEAIEHERKKRLFAVLDVAFKNSVTNIHDIAITDDCDKPWDNLAEQVYGLLDSAWQAGTAALPDEAAKLETELSGYMQISRTKRRQGITMASLLHKKYVEGAGFEGIVSSIAVTRLVPELAARQLIDVKPSELYRIARNSKKLIGDWAGMDADQDNSFLQAISTSTFDQRAGRKALLGFRLRPELFGIDPDTNDVKLRRDAARSMRDWSNHAVVKNAPHPDKILFGCPASLWLPGMHIAIASAAQRNNLYERL